jgi:uncharacterized protein YdeI (YjbR/CyaY-like superfamily)
VVVSAISLLKVYPFIVPTYARTFTLSLPVIESLRQSEAMDKAAARKTTRTARSFTAPLERMKSRLNWTIIHIPFDVAKLWGPRGQLRVRGDINGYPFRTSLFPTGRGGHILLVNKRMQKGAHAVPGSVARFRVEPDTEERVITMPAELNRILAQDRTLLSWVDQLSHSARAEIAKWVTEPKSREARARRADQIAERLLATMEAGQDLPPVLKLAFARNPVAHDGWRSMSATKRRGHLFGIFYYRTPEAQARRIEKMLDEATELAEKIRRRDGGR